MKKTDVNGQLLPTFIVSGLHVYPPNLSTVKAAARLDGFLQSCADENVSAAEYEDFLLLLCRILNNNQENKRFKINELIQHHPAELFEVFIVFCDFLEKLRAAHPLPSVYVDNEIEQPYHQSLGWDKAVANFANLSIPEVQRLNYVDYLIYCREALIYSLSQTEKGCEILQNAYCLEQTDADRAGLWNAFGGGSVAEKQEN